MANTPVSVHETQSEDESLSSMGVPVDKLWMCKCPLTTVIIGRLYSGAIRSAAIALTPKDMYDDDPNTEYCVPF